MIELYSKSLVEELRDSSQGELTTEGEVDSLKKTTESVVLDNVSETITPVLPKKAPGKPWKKAGTTDSGLHRDELTRRLDYGGLPKEVPVGQSGWKSEWSKNYYYAPGSTGLTAEAFEQTYESDMSTFPTDQGYSQVDSDTNFTQRNRPRPTKKGDKYISPDSKDDSGRREPPVLLDVSMGNMVWPLTGNLGISGKAVSDTVEISDKEGSVFVTYSWDQKRSKEAPEKISVSVSDSKVPSGAEAPTMTLDNDDGLWVPEFGENWLGRSKLNLSNARIENLVEPIVYNSPFFDYEKRPTKKRDISKDVILTEKAPDMKMAERLFTPIREWPSDTIILDAMKVGSEDRKILSESPKGDGKYFKWEYFDEEKIGELSDEQKKRIGYSKATEPFVVVTKKSAWDEIKDPVQESWVN